MLMVVAGVALVSVSATTPVELRLRAGAEVSAMLMPLVPAVTDKRLPAARLLAPTPVDVTELVRASAVRVMLLVADRPEVSVMLPAVDSREMLLAEMLLRPVELMVAEALTATVPVVSVTALLIETEPD